MSARLLDEDLAALRDSAQALGFAALGAVRLDHPGFEPARAALEAYLDAGWAGEMAFMERTREVRKDPGQMLELNARRGAALVGLVPYAGEPGPVARYAQWADYHTEVHRRLEGLGRALVERVGPCETLVCVDTKPVLERSAAVLAGLGFIGKSGCLIAPGLGSYVLIGVLLTDADWAGTDLGARWAEPAEDALPWDACGSCRACLDACPTDAFAAPGSLDPRRCIAYLTIEHRAPIPEDLAKDMGQRVAGCDVCQEVCPYNRSTTRGSRLPPGAELPRPLGRPREPDLPRLATIGSNQYRQFVKGTALNRIPKRSMQRNALIALGNGEGPLDPREREAIEAVLDGDNEALRTLAERALRRRGP